MPEPLPHQPRETPTPDQPLGASGLPPAGPDPGPNRYDANVQLILRRLADGNRSPKEKWWWKFM